MCKILLWFQERIKPWTKPGFRKTNKCKMYLTTCDWCIFLKTMIQMIPVRMQKNKPSHPGGKRTIP